MSKSRFISDLRKSSTAEAEAGVDDDAFVTPLKTKEALVAQAPAIADARITAALANTAEAEAGTNTTKLMTPARTKEAIAVLSPGPTIVTSPLLSYSAGELITFAHGQARAPDNIWGFLECIAATFGWNVGDRILLPIFERNNQVNGVVYADATNIYMQKGADSRFVIMWKNNGTSILTGSANFRIELKGIWY